MKEKELNFGESRDEEVEMVTTEHLRKDALRARVRRFFAEHGQAVINDPYGDEELKYGVQPTECGVAFTVEYPLPGRAVERACRFLNYVNGFELAGSAFVKNQDAVFAHHVVASPDDIDDVTIADALERLKSFYLRYAVALRFIEEEEEK